MPHFGKLFSINASIFFIFGLFVFFPDTIELHPFIKTLHALSVIAVALPLAGLNLTVLIERFLRYQLDQLERYVVTAAVSLTIVPIILMFEYAAFHASGPFLPILNSLVLFFLAVALHPFALDSTTIALPHPSLKISVSLSTLAFVLAGTVIITSFPTLPDSDPYYWLTKTDHELSLGALPLPGSYRPLLTYIASIFVVSADIDIYTFYKYLFPLGILSVLLPGALVARHFKNTISQVAILFLPLSSASVILYFLLPIPQALLNVLLTYFCLLLIHSYFSKRQFFYFFSGILMLLAFFYHELALFFALPWILITTVAHNVSLRAYIVRAPITALFALLLVLSHAAAFIPIIHFFINWLTRIAQHLNNWQPNFLFPAAYTNIDGKAVGWSGIVGVTQYYAYYGGLLLLSAVIICGSLWYQRGLDRQALLKYCLDKVGQLSLLIATLFLGLAEVLPRIIGLALLPERALGFLGLIVSLTILPVILQACSARKKKAVSVVLIIACVINLGGALYINSLKENLIPHARLASLLWIRDQLPSNRTIFVQNDLAVMETYSRTKTLIEIPGREFFTDIQQYDNYTNDLYPASVMDASASRDYIAAMKTNIDLLNQTWPESPLALTLTTLDQLSVTTDEFSRYIESVQATPKVSKKVPTYIYYNEPSRDTIYSNRPYSQNSVLSISEFVFDQHPDRFKKIYDDRENGIFIWQVLGH